MTIKYITGREQLYQLDVPLVMGSCKISKMGRINFSSNASLPRLSYLIGRRRISPRVDSGKVVRPGQAAAKNASAQESMD